MIRKTILICLLSITGSQAQETDLIERNSFLFTAGFSTVSYNKVFDNDGEKKAVPDASSSIFNFAAQYGLSNKWNISFNFPFVMNKVDGTPANPAAAKVVETLSAPGDAEIGIDYGFFEAGPWKAAASFYQSLGFAINDNEFGINTGYADYSQKLIADLRYKKVQSWYLKAAAGFVNHNDGFGDEILGRFEFEHHLTKGLELKLILSGIQPLENGDKKDHPVESGAPIAFGRFYGLYSQHAGNITFTPQLRYDFSAHFGIYASVNIDIIAQNYTAAPVYNAGLSLHLFKKEKKEIKQEDKSEDVKSDDKKEEKK